MVHDFILGHLRHHRDLLESAEVDSMEEYTDSSDVSGVLVLLRLSDFERFFALNL